MAPTFIAIDISRDGLMRRSFIADRTASTDILEYRRARHLLYLVFRVLEILPPLRIRCRRMGVLRRTHPGEMCPHETMNSVAAQGVPRDIAAEVLGVRIGIVAGELVRPVYNKVLPVIGAHRLTGNCSCYRSKEE
jgi:hypothetical protein